MGELTPWVEALRYAGDRPEPVDIPALDTVELIGHMVQSELTIVESVTPDLARCVSQAANRLGVPADAYTAFVYPSPTPQASCFTVSSSRCIIRFSSSLVELLDLNELCFVAGHELGHFVYQHVRIGGEEHDIDVLRQRRAQEISVDRTGLLATGTLESALSAILKLVSGLGSRHLRFDIRAFLSQLDDATPSLLAAGQSHPSLLVRARALLWFSMIDWSAVQPSRQQLEQLKKLDERIAEDIARFIDAPVDDILSTVRQELSMWTTVAGIVDAGGFSRRQQSVFAEYFGEDMLLKMTSFMHDRSRSELHQWVAVHHRESLDRIDRIAPKRRSDMEREALRMAGRILDSAETLRHGPA